MAKKGPESIVSLELISFLNSAASKNKAPIWRRVALELGKSRRNRSSVNLFKLEKYAKNAKSVIVLGSLLSVGTINSKFTVSAFKASKQAKEKIRKAGGEVISLKAMVEMNPEGTGILLLK